MSQAGERRRTIKKVYDTSDGTVSVMFPQFITSLIGVSKEYNTDSIQELVSTLQAMCLAEGIKPDARKWSSEDTRREATAANQKAKQIRIQQAGEERERRRKELGADFPDRVKITRDRLGDF